MRVVVDDNVDRLQVYNRDVKPSNTNCPKAFFRPYGIVVLITANMFSLSYQCQITEYDIPNSPLGVRGRKIFRWL